jgi:hypothetical protein
MQASRAAAGRASMADHYRGLAQSLVNLGFLFRRQGEGRREVWRNRRTDQEVSFDRDEVAKSKAAADAVLTAALAVPAARSVKSPDNAAPARPPRKTAPAAKKAPKPAAKPSGAHATPRKGVKRSARSKSKR